MEENKFGDNLNVVNDQINKYVYLINTKLDIKTRELMLWQYKCDEVNINQ